jgi:4-hydroxy-tetrahydrodipicolinate synthase
MKNKNKYYGIIPPIVTPLLPNETLDEQSTRNLVNHCIDGGVNGLFVNGTSGEAMRVTDAVWEDNTRIVLEEAKGRVPVFCGAIDSSTGRVIEKLKKIEALGGKIGVCTPPFYLTSFGQEEILRHYEKICDSTSLEIAIYNIPETTHANILPETIAKLADSEKIIIYKDSSADWQQVQRTLFLLEDKDIAFFNGAEELCAASMLYGAQGCIPGLATFMPELFVELYSLCKSGDVQKSYELQKRIFRIRKSIFVGDCWIAGMKGLLDLFKLGSNNISAPLPTLTPPQMGIIADILKENEVQV